MAGTILNAKISSSCVSQNYKFCIITSVSIIKYEFKISAIYYVTYLLMSAYLACATARPSMCSLG